MKKLLSAFTVIFVVMCLGSCKNDSTTETYKSRSYPDGILLEDSHLKAIFSKETGALLCLENKETHWSIQNRPELGISFNLLVPKDDKRSNYVRGKQQKLKSYEISSDQKTITFLWEKLQSEFAGELDIDVKGIVSLTESGLNFGMDIHNKSGLVIEAASYPVIGDMPQPAKESFECWGVGYAGFYKSALLPNFQNFKGYFGVDYPTQSRSTPETPFILAADKEQGLYVGAHDTSNKEMVSFTFELKPGYGVAHNEGWGSMITNDKASKEISRMEMNVWHFAFIQPGEEYSLSPIMLSPYKGSWHYGADVYKKWRKTWYQEPPTPQWVKDVHSWQQIQINCSEDNLLFPYKDLVKYAQQCAKHGVKAIQLTGWNNGGQDRANPSHDIDPRLGTWQEFKDAIAECEKMGVHIILFNKYTWTDQSADIFKKEYNKYAVRNMYGDYHIHSGYQYHTPSQLEDISTRRFIPMCMNSAKWRSICDNEFKKSIELGASGMLYDECQHHGGAKYCFDKTHGHRVPAFVFQGDAELDRGFRAITNKLKPDYLFAGEACYDLEYRYYNVSYYRLGINGHLPAQRYIDSDKGIMMAVEGFEGYMQVNTALRFKYIISYEPYFFKGQLEDFPLTMAYGEKVDNLRKKYKEYLWDGEFRDVLEATVTKDGDAYSEYSVFKTKENKHAAVIVNNDELKAINVSVKFENSNLPIFAVTPDKPEPEKYNGNIKIPAQSVVILIEK